MTQLLVSVKNAEEALVASVAGVDLIDLKDPNIGALGALDIDIVKQVLNKLDSGAMVSATIGEEHNTVESLINDIQLYADVGVHIVKVAVSDLFQQQEFFPEIQQLTSKGIKLVAVLFADQAPDLNCLATLGEAGFHGVMLDTATKQSHLLHVQSEEGLKQFLARAESNQLISGLAGSVGKSELVSLLDLQPTFIGMRGGVCESRDRTASISASSLVNIKEMLLNYNTMKI